MDNNQMEPTEAQCTWWRFNFGWVPPKDYVLRIWLFDIFACRGSLWARICGFYFSLWRWGTRPNKRMQTMRDKIRELEHKVEQLYYELDEAGKYHGDYVKKIDLALGEPRDSSGPILNDHLNAIAKMKLALAISCNASAVRFRDQQDEKWTAEEKKLQDQFRYIQEIAKLPGHHPVEGDLSTVPL